MKMFNRFALGGRGVCRATLCAVVLAAGGFPSLVLAQDTAMKPGEEVEVTSGAVTGLACALEARDKGNLAALTSCPLAEAAKEMVVFDVAEKQIYRVAPKKVRKFELEKAYGGGSVDFTAKVTVVNKKDGIPTVEVTEYTVNPKPKAGSFKGCL